MTSLPGRSALGHTNWMIYNKDFSFSFNFRVCAAILTRFVDDAAEDIWFFNRKIFFHSFLFVCFVYV